MRPPLFSPFRLKNTQNDGMLLRPIKTGHDAFADKAELVKKLERPEIVFGGLGPHSIDIQLSEHIIPNGNYGPGADGARIVHGAAQFYTPAVGLPI